MINLGTVKPGSTIRIPFSTFDKDDGSAITMSNFATGDILIYKDGNTTARASTNGFTATTDFSSKTGKQLAIIDLSDNSTADFYASGSEYLVAIDSVTVDTVTVGGWVARFRIGYAGAVLDTTIATLSSQTSFTLTTGPAEDDAINGMWAVIHDAASAVQQAWVEILDYTGSTKTVTLAAGATFTVAAKDNISVLFPSAVRPTVIGRTLAVGTDNAAQADVLKLSGDATAADNAEAFFDGTGYAGTNNVIPLVTTTTNLTNANPNAAAIRSAVGLASANLDNQLGAIDDYIDTEVASIITDIGTLLSRLSATRAGYLDNLNVGGVVASQADITALNQSASRRVVLTVLPQFERLNSGTAANSYTIELRTYDGDGAAVNADSDPTLTATGIVSGSLAANLSAITNPATGVYRWTYTVSYDATLEQIRFDASATISSSAFTISAYSQVCDFVSATWTTTDASRLASIFNKLPSKNYLTGSNNSDGDIEANEATGNFPGSVGSISGVTFPANFALFSIDTSGHVVLANASLVTAKLGTFALAKTTNITGFNDLSAVQVNSEVDTALADVGVTTTVTGRIDVATSTRAAAGDQMALVNGAITEAKITTPAETAGRPTGLLGMIRRLFEGRHNKRTRDRSTGAALIRNAADDATLETATQSTSGNTDTITQGS